MITGADILVKSFHPETFGMPYEIVHDIVRYAYDFPVSRTTYSLFLMKLQKTEKVHNKEKK